MVWLLWQFKFHVSRSGVRIPVKILFSLFFLLPLLLLYNGQSMKNIFWKTFSIDWYELSLESHHKKWSWLGFEPQTWKRGIALTGIRTPDLETWNCLDWDSNPRPGNMEFAVELELAHHAVEEKRESALWSLLFHTVIQWVFIRQLALSASRSSCPEMYVCMLKSGGIHYASGVA